MRSALLIGIFACGCAPTERLAPAGEAPYVPPPERCEPVALDDPERFSYCNAGSGIFGEWQLDDRGLPTYFYGLDQGADPRASYPLTEVTPGGEPLDRRSHWAAFGNRRINAMFFNEGYVEVVTQDRGVSYLNAFDESQGSYAGGFSYLDDGEQVWSTAHRFRPFGAVTERRFGMGWAEATSTHRQVRVTRVMGAPPGEAAVLFSEVTLENLGESPKRLVHYEVWDVGRRPIEISWIVSGKTFTTAPATTRRLRDERNGMFDEEVRYEPSHRRIGLRRSYVGAEARPDREAPSAVDYYPEDPFLVALDAPVDDVFVDQEAFFAGDPRAPLAVRERRAGAGTGGGAIAQGSGLGQPHLFAMKSLVELAPGERRTLRFAYGYARSGAPYETEAEIGDVAAAQAEHLRERLFYFASDRDPALHREMAWHAYQLETSVGYRDYWQGRVVPQGSAYLYLHGADGAARDLGLFAVPLVYTDPALAKEELRFYMGIQRASDGAFSYAFQGHGMLDDAGIHTAPSDLPIFFLWALGEYLGATGDLAFLDEPAPFYPREAAAGATTWDHLVAAARHLFDVVSTGEHGLIRVQTGDWSDGIVVEAPDRELAVEKGESVPNTQMAVAVLPRIAALIEARDPALSLEILERVAGYREALSAQWTGTHFVRAYYGTGEPVDADRINLESQIWALIGDTFNAPDDRDILVDGITEALDTPIGVALWGGGDVWPAISTLYTWGLARSHPDLAWDHLSRNTMRAHAVSHPEVWYGIWSGPDGLSSESGWSWASEVTPMRDFPVQNNNAHALPILAAIRVAGIEASDAGLVAAPASAESFALRSALVDLSLRNGVLEGAYRPTGARVLTVAPPPGFAIASATVNGVAVSPSDEAIVVPAAAGEATTFHLMLQPL